MIRQAFLAHTIESQRRPQAHLHARARRSVILVLMMRPSGDPHRVAEHERQAPALGRLQLSIDAVLVIAAMFGAAWLQGVLANRSDALKRAAPFSDYALLAYLVLPLWLWLVTVTRLHETFARPLAQSELLAKLLKLHLAGLCALALLQFLTQAVVNRSLVVLFMVCSCAVMYGQRSLCYAWLRYQHLRGHARANLLLVGIPSARMHNFVRQAASSRLAPLVLGYLANAETAEGLSLPPPDAPPLAKLGCLADLETLLEQRAVDQVVFFPPHQRPEAVPNELLACESRGIPASFLVELKQVSRAAPRLGELYEHSVISFDVAPKRPEALAIKHGLDPLLALLAIVLTLPVMLSIALAIAISMGRPVLFAQERAGRFGRPFRMLKFRTMHKSAESERQQLLSLNELHGPVFKARRDPRVTPLGRFLRRSSLDELPQLFNVLSGSMSMVGPRPLPVQEHAQIRGWQRRRLSVKPGITGLWQVSGRSDVDFESWMLLDLRYVDEWSLWLDLQIMVKTMPTVLFGRGAR
jgi:exopolysaccharide biosynthesis polyprenyl glycosylphosphotransferase